MKKWAVAIVVVVVLAALMMPGAMGLWLESNLRSQAGAMGRTQPGTDVAVEQFERGWFESTVSQQVVFELPGGAPASAGKPGAAASIVRLTIDSDVRHGPVLGAGPPGLASARSTIHVDVDGSGSWQIPGEVVTRIGLDGSGRSRYRSGPATVAVPDSDLVVEWGGGDVSLNFDRGFTTVDGDGRIEALSTASDVGTTDFGPVELRYDLSRDNGYGFWLGAQRYDVERAVYTDAASGQSVSVDAMTIDTRAGIVDRRIDSGVAFSVGSVSAGGLTAQALRISALLHRIDPARLAELQSAARRIREEANRDLQPDLVESMMLGPLLGLLGAGPSLVVETVEVTLPQGPVSLTLDLKLEELPDDAAADLVEILTRMTGNGRLRVARPVVAMISAQAPDAADKLGAALAMGLLVESGDAFETVLRYHGGLLTVNGNPIPLPLGAMLSQ